MSIKLLLIGIIIGVILAGYINGREYVNNTEQLFGETKNVRH